jgi:hypothetical protein
VQSNSDRKKLWSPGAVMPEMTGAGIVQICAGNFSKTPDGVAWQLVGFGHARTAAQHP